MVVKSDGSKWACQSCLKGHRVSGCNHTDRELTLVPKKGRPITQCQHCRQERKKRSAHVSCDCGEAEKLHHPKEKCIHLREAEERAKAGGLGDELGGEKHAAHLAAVMEEQGCCCGHGGKCTCAMSKKELERDDCTPPHGPAVKPRLETTRSEGSITVFQNGHHKPVHRKNHAAHECGMPYKVPISRAHTDQTVSARRSVDSLALAKTMSYDIPALSIPAGSAVDQSRPLSKSEQPSPKISATRPFADDSLTRINTIDFSDLGGQNNRGMLASTVDDFIFTPLEPSSGFADSTFDPWSSIPSGDSLPNNNPFGVWPTNADSSAAAQPALTAASSGTQSEIDEIPPIEEEPYGFGMPSIQEDTSAALNFNDGMDINASQSNRRSLPADFFSSTNGILPGMANDWEMPLDDFTGESKQKSSSTSQLDNIDNTWQMTSMYPMSYSADSSARQAMATGRPSSRSLGTMNAPDSDILKQLFPEFNEDSANWLGPGSTPSAWTSANPTSAPMDFSDSLDDATVDFTSQPWTDGSMSIPADNYDPSQYDLTQGYSNPDFSQDWSQ